MNDPILMCLLRRIIEASESLEASSVAANAIPVAGDDSEWEWYPEYIVSRKEYWERADEYENLADELISHLLLIPHPDIDTSQYIDLWKRNLALTEDERDNAELWEAVDDVAERAMVWYRSLRD